MPTGSACRDDTKAAEWYKLAADARRPRRDVRAGDVQSRRPCRAARSRGLRQVARGRRQARPCRRRLRSWPALYRGPVVSAGLRPRRRTVPHRRAGRQSRSAIRARHALQGRPRRDQGHARSDAAVGDWRRWPTIPTRRSNTPSRSTTATASTRTKRGRGADSARPRARTAPSRRIASRSFSRDRPRRAGRSGRGDQVAPDLQGAWRDRSVARRVRAQPRPREARRRREGGESPGSTPSKAAQATRAP